MSSDSEDEDFVSFGTPLELLDEDSLPKKRAITVEDQVAKDKHGRRRFHGAFTGRFSAGFFNTVGSLEGWKPSQFKSSRSSKSKGLVQRPEDFMDEEDMDEFGIAPKVLQTTGEYSQDDARPTRKRHLTQFSDGPIPGTPVLKTLIEPVRETVGIWLMKKMGWKPGQGVGPRLSKLEKSASRKSQKAIKIYGCALPSQEQKKNEDMSDDDSDEDHFDITFAPDDFEAWLVKPKDDNFGLGYSGLDRRPVLSTHIDLFGPPTSSLVMQEKMKKVNIRGQAFGVGAFEREDEDIYTTEDMSQYDFALDTPQMLAEKRQQERRQERNAQLRVAKSSSSDLLEGFLLSSLPLVRKIFPPPILPPGFNGMHRVKPSRFSEAKKDESAKLNVKRLTAHEREAIVNEPDSSLKTQPQTSSEVKCTKPTFHPFLADPEKQERYEKYLTLSKEGQPEKLKDLQPFTMTEWERDREKVEFEQAARLYRPLSAAFSDRFVRATAADDTTNPLVPVARTSDINEDIRNAAKMKMYGKLTRKIGEWIPHNILCKRFNIPPPRGGGSSLQTKSSRPKFSVFNFLDAAPFNNSAATSSTASLGGPGEISLTVNSEKDPPSYSDMDASAKTLAGEVDLESTQQKPELSLSQKEDNLEKLAESSHKVDLYKAIFLSSSEESDNEEDKSETSKTEKLIEKTTEQPGNILQNNSPPRGIFANLDLGNLNKPLNKTLSSKIQEQPQDISNLRNTSPPRGIFANLDFDSLKKPNVSKHSNQSEEKLVSDCSEKYNFATVQRGENSANDTSSTLTEQHNSLVKNNDKSNLPSCQLQPEMYGPLLPSNIILFQKPKKSENKVTVISSSSDSDDDWVEMDKSNSDSDTTQKHSSRKKHSKKSHRKKKKHKEKSQKHKKKRKK